MNKRKAFIPITALLGALLLALVATMTPFVAERDAAYAQSNPSSDANLEALSLSYNDGTVTQMTLSPTFAQATTSYTATTLVPFAATGVSVTANPNHAMGEVVGHPDTNATDSDAVTWVETLGGGGTKTTIDVTVRAQNGSTKTYYVTVYRKRHEESKENKLSALSLGTGAWTPGFSPTQTSYDVRVASDVGSVTVSYTPSDNAGGVSVAITPSNGPTVDSNNPMKFTLEAAGNEGTLTLVVTPEAGAGDANVNQKTYILNVYRMNTNPMDNANLTDITVNDGNNDVALSPAFAAATTSYTAKVANGIEQVTVTAPKDVSAKVEISPSDADGSAANHQVNLTAGASKTVTIKVTAEDTSITKTYTVKVYRERATRSAVKTLSALSLSKGALDPGFSSTVYAYDARVKSATDKVTVSYTPTDNAGGVSVVITGGTNVAGNTVTLNAVGTDTAITVAVTPEDGTTAQEYVITVYRDRASVLAQANIDSIIVRDNGTAVQDNLSPSFASGTTEYHLIVDNSDSMMEFVPTLTDATGASFVITPADADTTQTEHQVAVTAGQITTVKITVTAEDRSVTKTYTFNVYRKRAAASISDDATLSALSLSAGTLSPAFSTSNVNYTARVGNSVDSVTVSATPTDNAGGVLIAVGTPTACNDTISIATSTPKVSLTAGDEEEICVLVTAEDGAKKKAYSVKAYRERLNPSEDADLTTFSIAETTNSLTDIDLATTGNQTSISLLANKSPDVPYRVREVTVTVTKADDGAMTTVTPADSNAAKDGHQVALTEGAVTEIAVSVQAEDTTVDPKEYSAKVYRRHATSRLSKDATLKSLMLSDVVLTPEFDPATTEYTGAAAFSTKQTTVTAMPNDIGARIPTTGGIVPADADPASASPGHQVALHAAGGEYTVTVTVRPESNVYATTNVAANDKTYTIKITREATASDDAKLSSLSVMDGANDVAMTPAFDADTMSYTATVGSDVESVNVSAEGHVGATITGDTGDQSLMIGANTLSVMVKSEDESATETYTITVTREELTDEKRLLRDHDADGDGSISATELSAAIGDYLAGDLPASDLSILITLFLQG